MHVRACVYVCVCIPPPPPLPFAADGLLVHSGLLRTITRTPASTTWTDNVPVPPNHGYYLYTNVFASYGYLSLAPLDDAAGKLDVVQWSVNGTAKVEGRVTHMRSSSVLPSFSLLPLSLLLLR